MPENTTRDEDILIALTQHALKLDDLKTADTEMDTRLKILERILLLGDGDRKPLIQTMRDLEKQLSEFITTRLEKDRKEEQANNLRVEKEDANRTWMRRTAFSAVVTIILTIILPSIWQIILFWTRIYPLLTELAKNKAP